MDDSIDVPFVDAETALDEAFDMLRGNGRGAAVIRIHGEIRLVTIAEIHRGRSAGVATLGQLPGRRLAATEVQLSATAAEPARPLFEYELEGAGAGIGGGSSDGGEVRAPTFGLPARRPPDTAFLRGSDFVQYGAAFICNGRAPLNAPDAPHIFPGPVVSLNDPCPNCVTAPGARTPTIRILH